MRVALPNRFANAANIALVAEFDSPRIPRRTKKKMKSMARRIHPQEFVPYLDKMADHLSSSR